MIAVIYVTLCAFAIVQMKLCNPANSLSLIRVSLLCGNKIKRNDSIDKSKTEYSPALIQYG